MTCETCRGRGVVHDPVSDTPGPGHFNMECPDCCGHTGPVPIICPECGLVNVTPTIFASGTPISGPCPVCEYQLYFTAPKMPPTKELT